MREKSKNWALASDGGVSICSFISSFIYFCCLLSYSSVHFINLLKKFLKVLQVEHMR